MWSLMAWYEKAYFIALAISIVGMAVGVYLDIPKMPRCRRNK